MKIRGEVLKVETTGDHLRINLQTQIVGQALWRPFNHMEFSVPDNSVSRKTYCVGRILIFEVKPK